MSMSKRSVGSRKPKRGIRKGIEGGAIEHLVVVTRTVAVASCVPSGVTELGETEQVAAVGVPLQLRETVWLNHPTGVTVSVYSADCPAVIVLELGEDETEKSCAFTVRLKVLVREVTPLPLAVMVMVWPVTREALLAACRVIVPEFPVPG
jgi:hypothetical protein